ncbi:MAG: DUF72 domain-containing protein [Bacteroidota bacterium]
MKFGKLADISGVDFSLPPINPLNAELLGGKPAESFEAFIGLPRWSSKEWIDKLYPKGTKPADFLSYYSRSFNTIELNTTHYRIPNPEQVIKWRDNSDERFVFCPKIPQIISHYRKLVNVDNELAQFTESIREFGPKYGCSFMQVHESFGPSHFQNLVDFLAKWPKDLELAIEFRHADWFEERSLRPELVRLLTEQGIGTVITDVSGRRDVSHNSLTSKFAMIRLVGNSLDPTDFERSDAWLERIELWVQQGLEKLYLFPHEPGDVMAMDLGAYWVKKLNEKFSLNLSTPGIQKMEGDQMSLF